VFRQPETLAPATQGMESDLYPVSEAGLHAWMTGSAAYQTQLAVLFVTETKMRASLRTAWETRHGISLTHYQFPQRRI
jgi:hypothetical protein